MSSDTRSEKDDQVKKAYLQVLWKATEEILCGTGFGEIRVQIHNGEIYRILPTPSISFEQNVLKPLGINR